MHKVKKKTKHAQNNGYKNRMFGWRYLNLNLEFQGILIIFAFYLRSFSIIMAVR